MLTLTLLSRAQSFELTRLLPDQSFEPHSTTPKIFISTSHLMTYAKMRPNSTALAQSRRKLQQLAQSNVSTPAACLFCTCSTPRTSRRSKARNVIALRETKTTRKYGTEAGIKDERKELYDLLLRLKSEHPELVNGAQVDLALQSLRQAAGEEKVRVAILGLDKTDLVDGHIRKTGSARELLKALLADPLSDAQQWETEVTRSDDGLGADHAPVLVKVRPRTDDNGSLEVKREGLVREIEVSSPGLDNADLEVVVMDVPLTDPAAPASNIEADQLLVPGVAIDKVGSAELDFPVHKTVLVGNTFNDALKFASIAEIDSKVIRVAIDSKELAQARSAMEGSHLEMVDVSMAQNAVDRFRQGAQHGVEYEKLWHASSIRALDSFFKSGIRPSPGAMKQAVYDHLAHLISSAHIKLQIEKTMKAAAVKNTKLEDGESALAEQDVEIWAQNAHAELQEQLDRAFSGERWRQLGWWKLFWRVDDVQLLMGEMVRERFLPTSEKDLVYLTGGIVATLPKGVQPVFAQPESTTQVASVAPKGLQKWPGHIAFTRRYLLDESIPALQALAQKLVLQAGATSALTTALSALLYVSNYGLFEAGAVTALGSMYALGRMQKKWDTGRRFWEGEVREEGRKAVRGVESSLEAALHGSGEATMARTKNDDALEIVVQAQKKLESLKA